MIRIRAAIARIPPRNGVSGAMAACAADRDLGGRCRMGIVLTTHPRGVLVIKKLLIVLAIAAIGGLIAKKVTSS
jgi:hypothetical protein